MFSRSWRGGTCRREWQPSPPRPEGRAGKTVQRPFFRARRFHKVVDLWSGRWDLNPRQLAWEARTLPLSYARSLRCAALGSLFIQERRIRVQSEFPAKASSGCALDARLI